MILALDIGNSRVKLGWFARGGLCAAESVNSTAEPCLPEDSPAPNQVLMSCVAPATGERWRAWVGDHGWPLAEAGHELAVPLQVRYEPRTSLGVDRMLGAYAALAQQPAPLITCDCGTATTLNVVDADGVFMGGAIACGLSTQRDALAARGAQLPSAALEPPEASVGGDTIACLRSGLVLGQVAMVSGLAARMRAELSLDGAPLIATGGWADLLATVEPGLFAQVDEHLVLRGLVRAWQERER